MARKARTAASLQGFDASAPKRPTQAVVRGGEQLGLRWWLFYASSAWQAPAGPRPTPEATPKHVETSGGPSCYHAALA